VRSPIGCCNVLSEAGLQVGLRSAAGAGVSAFPIQARKKRKVQEKEGDGSYGLPSDVHAESDEISASW